jgi:hypothetical protein
LIIQAVVSTALLGWYVLAAHLDRQRVRREREQDFDSLVTLCRDLGIEAKLKTRIQLQELASVETGCTDDGLSATDRFWKWRADMVVLYVCLNEVPHYEVRNPEFSIALTRLWLEVDGLWSFRRAPD